MTFKANTDDMRGSSSLKMIPALHKKGAYIKYYDPEVWRLSLAIFIVAWIGQFIGHKIEGKKPSFFEDLQFLLIGPAWLLSFIYNKLGIKL